MKAQLDVGSMVEISVENGCLRVRAIRPRRHSLNDLLKGVRTENLRGEPSTAAAVGREEW
jgi:antitoxin component of MazEF toxin-antitoxin module